METELEEANAIANAANHKYEDVNRKCKVVEGKYGGVICAQAIYFLTSSFQNRFLTHFA